MGRLITLMLAIIVGLAGTYGVIRMGKAGEAQIEKVEVLVAATRLEPGSILTEDIMDVRKIPKNLVDPLAIQGHEKNVFLGQRVGILIEEGGYITSSAFESSIVRNFQRSIKSGKRALSINVSRSTGVSGLIQPGSRVDIIGTFSQTIEYRNVKPVTRVMVLLQNIEVLAAGKSFIADEGQSSGPGTSVYSTITLAVSPAEAEVLIAAELRGRLFCVLRNPEDSTLTSTEAKNLDDLLNNPNKQ
jgi:pilus assembly protein CpaB